MVSRQKVSGDIVPMSFPKIRPEDGVGIYLASKLAERQTCNQPPSADAVRASLAMDLVKSHRMMQECMDRLVARRETGAANRQNLDEEWKDLKIMELELNKTFKKFHNFVKENEEKRERAVKKLEEDEVAHRRSDGNINEITEEIKYLHNIKMKMEQKLKEYKMFEDFLNGIVSSTSTFKHIRDVLNRYAALCETKTSLSKAQQDTIILLQNAREELARIIERKTLHQVGLRNQVIDLQRRYEKANTTSLLWETVVSKIIEVTSEKMCELEQVKGACFAVYKNLSIAKSGKIGFKKNDHEKQLRFIKTALGSLDKIVRSAHHARNTEVGSIIVEESANDSYWSREIPGAAHSKNIAHLKPSKITHSNASKRSNASRSSRSSRVPIKKNPLEIKKC